MAPRSLLIEDDAVVRLLLEDRTCWQGDEGDRDEGTHDPRGLVVPQHRHRAGDHAIYQMQLTSETARALLAIAVVQAGTPVVVDAVLVLALSATSHGVDGCAIPITLVPQDSGGTAVVVLRAVALAHALARGVAAYELSACAWLPHPFLALLAEREFSRSPLRQERQAQQQDAEMNHQNACTLCLAVVHARWAGVCGLEQA
eukprot:CAMPEP_0175399896 /NCGR_PEP_ID=MMETSP0095-20121207/36225_1 /TAXON_ID=311494 /ORGANISM="Alexandrium monilatum, Strain CCMP3105" /LENGTH=200 /DNA_ID=CAMNT_0016698621 /DNA_START=74 /DNA_END=672 /DNA_ORIENTATION=+